MTIFGIGMINLGINMGSIDKEMELKDALKEYKLELIFYGKEIGLFRKALKKTQESHALWCEEEEEKYGGKKAVIFRIYCSTTSFALAYYILGFNVSKFILSKRK